jgi:hypothetical protein
MFCFMALDPWPHHDLDTAVCSVWEFRGLSVKSATLPSNWEWAEPELGRVMHPSALLFGS